MNSTILSRLCPALRPLALAFWLCAMVLSGAVAAQDRQVHEGKSQFGSIIVMENPQGLRTLYFERNGARQSAVKPGDPDHLELSYARYVMAGLALSRQPERMLVVGLGGGSLPMFLRQRYPQAVIDVAEIDPAVADVARRFMGFREDARMRVHVGDGREYIEKAQPGGYDLIFLDAFGAHEVPPHLVTAEFLRAVRRALRADGVAVGNVWGPNYNRLYGSMMRTYEAEFGRLYVLDVGGAVNRIALALPRGEAASAADVAARASLISRERGFPYDLGELVRRGWMEREDYGPFPVLHDLR